LWHAKNRTPERRVFLGFGGDRFRTATTRACLAAAVPRFSPHVLGDEEELDYASLLR